MTNGSTARNARMGVLFFFVYAVVYAGFVGITTFRYDWMGTIVFAGVNLAVVYGVGLIVLAFVMAVVYMLLCGNEEADSPRRHGDTEKTNSV